MSDSEDDKPLAARNVVRQPEGAQNTVSALTSSKPEPVSASIPQDAIKRKAAQKAPVKDESDSEDDKPLLTRAKPAARPGSGGIKKTSSHADAQNGASKHKSVTVKKEAIKIEPLSPKSEPEPSTQGDANVKKPRAKKGEGDKKVIVKKEYEKPGQTRETPSMIDPLRRFYTTLREQRPDSEMAKKWCLIHGVLDDEEAEQIAAELKVKKGQLRSPSKALSRAPAPKRKAPPGASNNTAGQSSKGATKPKVKYEESDDDSFEDDDFLAPAKKAQKQGSGTTAGTASKPKPAAKPANGDAAKGSNAVAAASAQARGGRPASGGSRPSSAQGSKAAGASRPGSGGSGKAAGDKPAPKPRALVASTTKDRAFADGGLDPVSDSDDEMPLAQRRVQRA